MSVNVALIVEGHGEREAARVLIGRLCVAVNPEIAISVLEPIRVHRDQFLNKESEFRRYLLLAASKAGDAGLVLVLLDADDDCPATRGPDILARAKAYLPHRSVSVVLANREFEAWFIAAAQSLDGARGFIRRQEEIADPERYRDAKGWLSRQMQSSYREMTDQAAFAARMDLSQALAKSRSFRKLYKEIEAQLARLTQD